MLEPFSPTPTSVSSTVSALVMVSVAEPPPTVSVPVTLLVTVPPGPQPSAPAEHSRKRTLPPAKRRREDPADAAGGQGHPKHSHTDAGTDQAAEEYVCTLCCKQSSRDGIWPHPLIQVIVCDDCIDVVFESMEEAEAGSGDEDEMDACAWCWNEETEDEELTLLCCDKCPNTFCTACECRAVASLARSPRHVHFGCNLSLCWLNAEQ